MKEGDYMAYYLMVENKGRGRSTFEPIDISKSPCFYRFSVHTGSMCELQEIDYFTMTFNNKKELLTHLVKNRIIESKLARKKMSIRRKSSGQFERVSYDFLYQDSLEYVMEPRLLINMIEDKLYQEDFNFLADLANHYANKNFCSTTACEVRQYASDSILNNFSKKYLYQEDENHDILVTRLVKLIIYKNYQDRFGRTVYQKDKSGKLEVDYRRLHDLLAWISQKENEIKKKLVRSGATENQNPVSCVESQYEENIFDLVERVGEEVSGVAPIGLEQEIVEQPEDMDTPDGYRVMRRSLKKENFMDGQYSLF